MSNSESSEDDNLPTAAECERRCQEFAAVTGTDSACAMFFLQDRDWDVQRSLNAYFEETGKTPTVPGGATSKVPSSGAHKTEETPSPSNDPEPHRIRILSWNIDGLDTNNIRNRSKGVCKTILQEKPDVVFLQEVVRTSEELLEKYCPEYQLFSSGTEGYYCAMMLKASSIVYKEHSVEPFFSSIMSRSLLKVKARVKDVDMFLMTTHLESTAPHADERKRQLGAAFKILRQTPASSTVVFGGDLNLRDKELAEIGGPPENVYDIWEVTGKRPEAKYTWDLSKNDNLEWNGKFRPKCRFDRLFIRNGTADLQLKPVYFELVGIERLASCKRFPSDHWGILAHFDKKTVKK